MVKEEKFSRYKRPFANELLCSNESICAETSIENHKHDFIELSYVRKGNAIHIVNGNRFYISEGDLFLLSLGCEHQFEDVSKDFTWINILFLPQLFEMESTQCFCLNNLFQQPCFNAEIDFRMQKKQYIHLHHTDAVFKNIFKEFLSEYYNALQGYMTICRNIIQNLLFRIARQYMSVCHAETKTTKENLVGIVYDYFKLSSSFHKIKLEDIAQRVHMNPDYLGKLFKKKVGINLSVFIRNIRLEYAALHLRTTNMNICEIMRFVGYQDTKNFYKAFKEVYGMTPAGYRKKYKGVPESEIPKLFLIPQTGK